MRSEATDVTQYLAELPPDRRQTIAAVREMILEALPDGYVESVNWGMIAYEIPLERYPETYNGQPLGVVALASQKNKCSLYLHGPYMDPDLTERIRAGFEAAGKKLDMGKSCIRFKTADDLVPDVIREAVSALDPDQFIGLYERARRK
ncbi:MAG TPA: DUF1801 domain-containing protein [Longimicrobiales bacterium]|nr:DUF1801 domain-containing protein [Longimicrobiales bacterium]